MAVKTQALDLDRLVIYSQRQPWHQLTCLTFRFLISSLFLTHGDALISFQDQTYVKEIVYFT